MLRICKTAALPPRTRSPAEISCGGQAHDQRDIMHSKRYEMLCKVWYCTLWYGMIWYDMIYSPPRSSWRYSPEWALVSAAICLKASRFLALSLHSFIPIFLRSMDTSSSHLVLGLPLRLVAYSFPYSIFFGIAVSCIISICSSHLILWHLINLTMFCHLIMASKWCSCAIQLFNIRNEIYN